MTTTSHGTTNIRSFPVDGIKSAALRARSTVSSSSSSATAERNQMVLERLAESEEYKQYERAFSEAMGLPLSLTPVDNLQLAHRNRKQENPFCAIMARQNKTCATCLQTQHDLATKAQEASQTVTCAFGLSESAIPVRIGEEVIGYLRTGEVLLQAPTEKTFARAARLCEEMGVKADPRELREAYFRSKVLRPRQYESIVQLLRLFAQHLSIIANQVVFRTEHAEPPLVARAREFISANYGEDLSLAMVAKAVHMSTFYFCKQFKKATGLSFTNYLGRVRVEKAKEMLLDPHVRISEVAYECGFQSLTHFNRVFRKLVGESPTAYRTGLPLAQAA